jgi:glutamate synthase (NADPH/NADH) small chain
MLGCPIHNDIPTALWLIEQGDFIGAAEKFRETSTLPEVCGRVCPHLCQDSCVLSRTERGAVAIGKLEAFVADYQKKMTGVPLPDREPPTGFRVAVVGAGPAGLTVAEELTKKGHEVVVYDAWPRPGGVLIYGIPSFKLQKKVVDEKIQYLERMGVRFITRTRVGVDIQVDDLFASGYHAVFLGTGAGIEARLDVPGEDLEGVYHSTDFLIRANLDPSYLPETIKPLPPIGQRVAIFGGGDTATDCARTAVRLGATDVRIIYRRSEAEMPGSKEERAYALEEGVVVEYLTAPVKFLGDEHGHVQAVVCQRMTLGEPDASGRRRPIPIPGSEFTMPVDSVVLAIGYWPDPLLGERTPGLKTRKYGLIVADEDGRTTREGVFAGGDNVHGPDLVVTAMAAGKRAAAAIHQYLMSKRLTSVVSERETAR